MALTTQERKRILAEIVHTPGPWTDISDEDSKPDPRMALVVTSRDTTAIDCTKSGKNYKEDCANARLIAAAPEMLEALEQAAIACRYPERVPDMRSVVHQIDAAVRKAKGLL